MKLLKKAYEVLSVYKNKHYGEKIMMIFKPMTLVEAKEFYQILNKEPPSPLVKIAMEDIWFFTNGLQTNYGGGLT